MYSLLFLVENEINQAKLKLFLLNICHNGLTRLNFEAGEKMKKLKRENHILNGLEEKSQEQIEKIKFNSHNIKKLYESKSFNAKQFRINGKKRVEICHKFWPDPWLEKIICKHQQYESSSSDSEEEFEEYLQEESEVYLQDNFIIIKMFIICFSNI